MRGLHGISPHPRLLILTAGWGLAAVAGAMLSLAESESVRWLAASLEKMVLIGVTATVLLSVWDLFQIRRIGHISLQRHVPQTLSLSKWVEVELELRHELKRTAHIELFDHYPIGADIEHLPCRVELRPDRLSTICYRMRPNERGDATFGLTELRIPTPFKCWRYSRMCGSKTTVRVYPDFAAVTGYALLAIDNHTSLLGVKKRQRRGEGLEFHQLRDYRPGDSIRQVDWKATARRQKLISKEYQDERDQQVFFMVDCGRRMRARDGHLSHFDHALNALLLLSYVALRQGDAVGLMSFGGERRWLSPQKGKVTTNTILNTVYDLHPTTRASDYSAAAQELLGRQRKRSLLVLLTNLREENVDDLIPALHTLGRHHLVMLANLREKIVDHTLHKSVDSFDQALRYAGAASYLDGRQRTHDRLRRQGVLVLDTVPGQLAVHAVNSYLEIKRSGYL